MSNSERECTFGVLTDEQLEIVSGGDFDDPTNFDVPRCGIHPVISGGGVGEPDANSAPRCGIHPLRFK